MSPKTTLEHRTHSVRSIGSLSINDRSKRTSQNLLSADSNFGLIDKFCGAKRAEGKSPITFQQYGYLLRAFFRAVNKNIKYFLPGDLRKYAETLARVSKSDTNYNAAATAIRSFFKWAYMTELVEKDLGVFLPMRRVPQDRPIEEFVWLTLKEQKKLRAACKGLEPLVVNFFLDVGCRNGRHKPMREFCGLGWGDFDFERNLIKIHGKGPGENGKLRYSHFDDKLKKRLLRYRSSGGGLPVYVDPQENVKLVRKVARRAGITRLAEAKNPVHALKHTHCTNWVIIRRLKGLPEDLRGLSKQVGTGIKTLEVYIHIADEYLKSSYDETMRLLKEESDSIVA